MIQLSLAGRKPMRPEVQKALDTLNRYGSLTNAQFDEIVEVECGVPFDDDELISALIDSGWHYLQHGATWDEEVRYLRVV